MFPVNFAKFLRTPYLQPTSERLPDFICGVFLYFPLSKIFATKKVASCEKSPLVEDRLYANKKSHPLIRVSTFTSLQKRRILITSLIALEFNYCPIAWMCHSKNLNNKVKHIHERALNAVYQDF